MRSMPRWCMVGLLALVMPGCLFSEDDVQKPSSRLTKAEAAQKMKDDPLAPDYCSIYSWYQDDVCDDFCREPDPKCPVTETKCSATSTCPSGQFCDIAAGLCASSDQSGTCKPKPQDCDADFAPVCGCDGKTYSNACEAQNAGVAVEKTGECEPVSEDCQPDECGPAPGLPNMLCPDGQSMSGPTGRCLKDEAGTCSWEILTCPAEETCGGITGKQCADGYTCVTDDGMCQVADAGGVCRIKTDACPDIYKPVCGCDGKTYGNRCEAAAAGAAIDKEGECATTGATCGGKIGTLCAKEEYCQYKPEDMCGTADQTGTCSPKPELCDKKLAPVCGCDGKTYDNACFAALSGISVASEGACEQEKVCGGIAGISCGSRSEYCAYPQGTCNVADRQGTCQPRPLTCPASRTKVCGCDGKTYDGECEAIQAGVSVDYEGACGTQRTCTSRTATTACLRGEVCYYDEGTCNSLSKPGVCIIPPTLCPRIYKPVCGCDGKTYSNDCEAKAANVAVSTQGACRSL